MSNIKFFNDTPTIPRLIFGGIFVAFSCWLLILILEKPQLDPLVKTIGISIALWAGLFSLHTTLLVKKFFINNQEHFIGYTKGIVFLNKTHTYPYSCIKSIELRTVDVKPNDSDISENSTRNTTKRYYCVLILKNDELYMEGSSDEKETLEHVKEISKHINIPYKVNFHGKNRSKASEVNILRLLFLLCICLLGMFGLFQLIVAYS